MRTAGTGAYQELGLVYAKDIQNGNQGPAFPTSPGHYQEFTCASGGAIVR